MKHFLYLDGDLKRISWIIQTDGIEFKQTREHVEEYRDKITKTQSKYVALHIALFWGIGTFKNKNYDDVKIILDEKTMYDQLKSGNNVNDEFIKNKIKFIQMFIKQRKLKIEFSIIDSKENISSKLLK